MKTATLRPSSGKGFLTRQKKGVSSGIRGVLLRNRKKDEDVSLTKWEEKLLRCRAGTVFLVVFCCFLLIFSLVWFLTDASSRAESLESEGGVGGADEGWAVAELAVKIGFEERTKEGGSVGAIVEKADEERITEKGGGIGPLEKNGNEDKGTDNGGGVGEDEKNDEGKKETEGGGVGAVEKNRDGEEGTEVGCIRGGRDEKCPLGFVYVYELPPMFNCEILEKCQGSDRVGCEKMENRGLGPALGVGRAQDVEEYGNLFGDLRSWFFTHIKADIGTSEELYHERMLQQPCRTEDPSQASAFYLPYYASLALEEALQQQNSSLFNVLPRAFIAWLAEQPYFKRNGGHDHFMVLGGSVWKFQLDNPEGRGCALLKNSILQNVTKLTNARNPWDRSTVGIPYPVFFHPSTDEQMRNWQERVRSWPRKHLVGFAGSGNSFTFSSSRSAFRVKLMDECEKWDQCSALDCKSIGDRGVSRCHYPLLPMKLMMDSDFCLQPPGDTPTRKSVFDGLTAGCIPVFFQEDSAYTQYLWYLPWNSSTYSVLANYTAVEEGSLRVQDVLSAYSPERIREMRNVIIDQILPGLVIANPSDNQLHDFQDAASRSLKGMLTKIARRKAGLKHDIPTPYMLSHNALSAYENLQTTGLPC